MGHLFAELTLGTNLALFLLFATGVWYAGSRLTYLADALADRLKLAKSLMGLLVLSLATSLPVVATTLGSAIQQNRDLVLNNLFGGIALQTAILATADLSARGAITNYPRKANHALEAALLVVLLSVALIFLILGEPFSVGFVGLGSLVIGLAYGGAIWLLRRYDGESDWVPVDIPSAEDQQAPAILAIDPETSIGTLVRQAGLACLGILVLGIALIGVAEATAVQSGLGAGFIGVTFLAATTSLPELTTTITAVRMGAYTLAISNIFGSNLIMLVLVLPADFFFVGGPILAGGGKTILLAICFGIVVTGVYLIGLIVRRKPRVGNLGIDSIFVLLAFSASLLAYYIAR